MLKKFVLSALIFALSFQLLGCGTLIHPERRGQTGGRIDPGVAVLDGIGLLFFVVPGLVAFAIDFSTGAIYLPGGSAAAPTDGDLFIVQGQPGAVSVGEIEALLFEQTGKQVDLRDGHISARTLDDVSEIPEVVASLNASGTLPR